MLENVIKRIIAESLRFFLISNHTPPEEIEITVHYPESVARLRIDAGEIAKVLSQTQSETEK